jgi:hypothetical protein
MLLSIKLLRLKTQEWRNSHWTLEATCAESSASDVVKFGSRF